MANTQLSTDTQIKKAIRETAKAGKPAIFTIKGSTGLQLRIRPSKNGTDTTAEFKYRYTHPITGTRHNMTLGKYPALSLADAKLAHSNNQNLRDSGIDPLEHKETEARQKRLAMRNTLDYFIREWLDIMLKKDLHYSTIRNYQRYIEPIEQQLGHLSVTDIKASTVIQFIKNIEKQSVPKSKKVKLVLWGVLQLALSHGAIEYNPASNLKGTLSSHKKTHRPAITDPKQFGELLNDIDQLDDTTQLYTKRILQLLALTFVRVGDLCAMKWADIDLNAKQWAFEQQKGATRDDMQASLVVPLAPQAIALLEGMKALTGDYEYVFYNGRRKQANYHDRKQVLKTLSGSTMNDGKGYQGIHCSHGFRSSAKTMLTERLGYDELLTELALGHTMLNKYGRAYNRMTGLEQRRQMMTAWADYLDQLRAGKIDNVIYPDFKQAEQVKHG